MPGKQRNTLEKRGALRRAKLFSGFHPGVRLPRFYRGGTRGKLRPASRCTCRKQAGRVKASANLFQILYWPRHTPEESNNPTHLDMAAKSTRGFAALRFRSESMRAIDVDFFRDARSTERPVSIGHVQDTA